MDSKTFTDRLSRQLGIDKEHTSAMIEALRDTVAEKCGEMDSVAIPGFGAFEPRKRLERVTIHPASGKRLLVPPKIVLSFKPSAVLKQRLKDAD